MPVVWISILNHCSDTSAGLGPEQGVLLLTHLILCSLQMITKNFEDYPEHRLKFFSLLRAIASHCFRALFSLSSQVSVYCLH